jgi:large repetitive protein
VTVSAGTTATIAAEATTVVQFRAVDGAGNVSAWAPAANGAANTVKLDRTAPTLPAVSGGSTVCVKKRTISASGSVDAVSGVARYEYRSSSNNGSTWSAAVVGSSVQFTVVGKYIVQFRTVDNAGNTTAWAPATSGSGNTACIK